MYFFNNNLPLPNKNSSIDRLQTRRQINNIILVLKYCGQKKLGLRSLHLDMDLDASFNSATGHVNVTWNGHTVCDSQEKTFVPGEWYQMILEQFSQVRKSPFTD